MPRFSCRPGCTACCRQSGFVYLTEADVARIATHLGMDADGFEKKYVYRTRHLRRLRMPRSTICRFLREDGCSIHAVKPTQCRIFPFWPDLIESACEWRKTGQYCPGIGDGELIAIETARELAEEMRSSYPGLYPRRGR